MADDEKGKKREEPTFSKVIAKKATIIPYRVPESVSKKAKEWLKRAMEENKIPINIESADLRDIARTFLEELKRMNRALQKYA